MCVFDLWHNMILSAKKKYYSNFISSSSDNFRRLWQTFNNLLHRKCSSNLPFSTSDSSLADSLASFFDKISLLLSHANISSSTSPHKSSPPVSPSDFSTNI